MPKVIRERACRENETRTRDGGGRKSRGNARRETLEAGIHAYATISFDYIIVFRPGGIIHVNKLHIFFHSAFLAFFVRLVRAAPRPTVAILSLSLIRDDYLISCLVSLYAPRCTRYESGGLVRDNPFDSTTDESLRSFQVGCGDKTNDALKFLIQPGNWRTNARVR